MSTPLSDLKLRPRYVSGYDNILEDFLIPCLSISTSYCRAAGYFSSAVLSLSWRGLRSLYRNGGAVRVVCSPALSEEDWSALARAAAAEASHACEKALREDFQALMSEEHLRDTARALAALVVSGFLEIRIAVPTSQAQDYSSRRLFHQKTGLFSDPEGNTVAFSGSMNETWTGVSPRGNHESIQVFCTWHGDREETRVYLEARDFEDLWENRFPGVNVMTLTRALEEDLFEAAVGVEPGDAVDRLAEAEKAMEARGVQHYSLRPHQAEVLSSWAAAGYRGIVKHATGSGKTISAIHAIRSSEGVTSTVIVIVPSEILLDQWEEVIESYGPPGVPILLCGGGNTEWRRPGVLEAWTSESRRLQVVLAVQATASKPEFVSRVQGGDHLLMVADEVHRLGAADSAPVLSLVAGRVLGLSATPERAGDPEGTQRIFNYFGDVLSPIYGIADAIRDGVLTPYYYSPVFVEFTPDEQEKWNAVSHQIARLAAQIEDSERGRNPALRRLLIRRAKIAKQAHNKIATAVNIVRSEYAHGQRWLLYCDSSVQMHRINEELRNVGVDSRVYYSEMDGDKETTLSYFESVGGVLVSIRCLDEGVDIPAASHALIIASSRNPREFIQRRGRVLRRSPGKDLSYIHDILVAPSRMSVAAEGESYGPLVGEISRAVEFADFAVSSGALNRLLAAAIGYGLNAETLRGIGFEVDGVDDEEGVDE